ncbi:MAG: glycosyltransferase family 4 protein [Janthinobacterium lividum]
MKIVHIANDANRTGNGIINTMVDLACIQAKMGHEVSVITGGGDFVPLLEQYGVKHVCIKHRSMKGAALIKSTWEIYRFLRRERPDVVHGHMIAGIILSRAARTFIPGRSFFLISTVHNEFQKSAKLMGLADKVVGVSDAVTESMIRRGLPKRKMVTVCNGVVGSPRLEMQENSTGKSDKILLKHSIITVAGMYKRKGIDVLLHAFKQILTSVPMAHLYIVGNGPDKAEFEALAKSLQVAGSVEFMGLRHDVVDLMQQADVFVLASRRDPCPLVIVEARQAGCAIVASDVDGIPQLLENGRAGVLAKVDDPQDFAAAIGKLLTDPVEAERMRVAARENLEWLSIDRVAKEYLDIYRQNTRQ